jgi:hypothetical protein
MSMFLEIFDRTVDGHITLSVAFEERLEAAASAHVRIFSTS